MNRLTISLLLAGALCSAGLAAPQTKSRTQTQPLTFENVTRFFHEALGRAPVEVEKRCVVFVEGEWKNANVYNHSLVMVENADVDIQVTFIMTGDEGLNWVNEFFDSPFFERTETETLFSLLGTARGTKRINVGRFAVELNRWQPRHHEIVAISLTKRR